MSTWSSTTVPEVFVRIDDTPLWVRLSAIQAVRPSIDGHTRIFLASGEWVATDVLVDDVMDKMAAAVKR